MVPNFGYLGIGYERHGQAYEALAGLIRRSVYLSRFQGFVFR